MLRTQSSAVPGVVSNVQWANAEQGVTEQRAALVLFAGFLALYLPTYWMLAQTVWPTDEQGHGPIILAVTAWLVWRNRAEYAALPYQPSSISGSILLAIGALLYLVGRTQQLDTFEVGSQLFILAGILLVMKGAPALRLMLFPIFFLLFTVPLPSAFVQMVTVPLKASVSVVAEYVLYIAGYPIARSGVILSVGPYQLLVADACAGLNSMFTLEALGLLYLKLMGYSSKARNVLLAILVIPIAFIANVVRVILLVLITYHLGDEAGQGFLHGLAGMSLFMVALMLILATDRLLGLFFERPQMSPPISATAHAHRTVRP